jgi:hypothetical protein
MSHALVAVYDHPRETWSQQQRFLHERIIPMVKSHPGFVSGNWSYEKNESKSYTYIVFASEADARKMETFMRDEAARPNPFGVALGSITVVDVIAEARAG